jgi:transposase
MDRQTLRDWVIRFNEQGPDGLINIPSPGAPAKLDETHKAFWKMARSLRSTVWCAGERAI